ncbi:MULTISPECIES: phospholipase D family protein [Actinomycetes]|uniref:phospholipase D family protein n=1 Tax=Actinomycetes TaxID=1760 RepID=UPI0025CBAED1|nr:MULTISPECIES: phospholipase D family protein [unclassified Microbacterium]
MLEPDSRSLLSELLRPPAGFHLSHAVGTSFTMTLEAALSIPLAFAGAVEVDDEVGILGAVRRATQRIDLFAQAGCLGLGTASELVTVLEPMVHPVRMPGSRLFHPKVWFLEFERNEERRYRFVCSSRNLTNDRTWDAVISLDGGPDEDLDEETVRSNHVMAGLLRWLVDDGRTAPALAPDRADRIARLAEAWAGIRWEHPDHVRAVRVHALGIGLPSSDAGPRLGGIRTAVVSPFVTDEGVRLLRSRPGGETTLLSRPEALDRLQPETLQGLSLRVLDEMVDQALADAETSAVAAGELRGLHAKIVVHDHAHKQSTLLVGSANATGPAWSNNVEVMVEAEGPKSHLGVEAVLGSLAPLIEEYTTAGGAQSSQDEEADRRLESALRELARARLVVRVNAEGEYTVTVWAEGAQVVDDRFTLSWRMLSQPDPIPGPLPTADAPYESTALRLEQITPFVVIALTDGDGRRRETLLVADLLDDVPGRGDAIVAAHLTEPGAVARFIRIMLQDGSLTSIGTGGGGGAFSSAFGAGVTENGAGLLELLVRATATNRSGLVDVERVLRHVPEDARSSALPPGFTEVWAAITEAAGVQQ